MLHDILFLNKQQNKQTTSVKLFLNIQKEVLTKGNALNFCKKNVYFQGDW